MPTSPPKRPLPDLPRPTEVGPVGAAAGLQGLHAGVAQADLTPALRLGRTGYGPNATPGYGALGRLLATVMVLDDGGDERVAIVAAELHAGFRWVAEHLAARCARMGLTVDRIFFASSHTHTGPGPLYGHATYDRIAGTAYLDDWSDHFDVTTGQALVSRLAVAVEEAVASLAPARIGYGFAPLWRCSWNRSVDALFWMPEGDDPADPDVEPPTQQVDRDEAGYRRLAERINRGIAVPRLDALAPEHPVPPEALEGLEDVAGVFADPDVAGEAEFLLDVMDLADPVTEAPGTCLDDELYRLVHKQRTCVPAALPVLLQHARRVRLKRYRPTRHRDLGDEAAGDRALVDARVHCLWAETPDGEGLGAICFFGATSTLLGDDHAVYCADAYGEAARRVERRLPGVRVGFAGGTLGDVNLVSPRRGAAAHPVVSKTWTGALALIDEAAGPLADATEQAIATARGQLLEGVRLTAGWQEATPGGRSGFPDDAPRTHTLGERGFTTGPSALAASELAGGQWILRKLGFVEGRSKITRDDYDAVDPHWPKLMLPPMEHPPTDLPFRCVRIEGVVDGTDTVVALAGFPGEVSTMLGCLASEALEARLGGPGVQVRPVVASLVGDYAAYLGTVWEYLAQHYEGASTLYGRWTGEWALHQLIAAATAPSRRATGTARFSGGTCISPRTHDPTRSRPPKVPESTLQRLARRGGRALIAHVHDGVLQLWGCLPVRGEDRGRPLWFGPRVAVEQRDGDGWKPVLDDRSHRFLVWREDDGDRSLWLFHTEARDVEVVDGATLSLAIRRDIREPGVERLIAGEDEAPAEAPAAPGGVLSITVRLGEPVITFLDEPEAVAGVEEGPPVSAWLAAHTVPLGDRGRLARSGRLRATPQSLAAQLTSLDQARRLVVYFHGGLVSEGAGIALATDLGPFLEQRTGATPLFVVWKTGPVEVLPRTVLDLLTQPKVAVGLFRWVLKVLGFDPLEAAADLLGLEGLVEPPSPWSVELDDGRRGSGVVDPEAPTAEEELVALLEQDLALAVAVEELRSARDGLEGLGPASGVDLLDPRFVDRVAPLPEDGLEGLISISWLGVAKAVLGVARRVLGRRETPGWNGWKDTILEEVVRELGAPHLVGAAAWNRMKENAREAWLDGHGGALLADRLAAWLRLGGRELHVVGHSAGSYQAGHLLEALARRVPSGQVLASLTLLAPACDLRFFERSIAAHRSRVARHRLFLLTEAQEDREKMIPGIYRGSLLNLVSGLLEPEPGWPILGMARFLGAGARQHFGEAIVRAPTATGALPPASSRSLKHGGFDDDPATRRSLAAVIGLLATDGLEVLVTPPVLPSLEAEAAVARELNAEDEPALEEALEALQPLPAAVWPPDADSIDYAHLPDGAGPPAPFVLTGEVLARLVVLNRFHLVRADRVLFGLRGCDLVGDADHVVDATSVELREARPDHVHLRCVIGVWQRSTGLVSVFRGSTVPNARYLAAYIGGGPRANLLPTGAYRYVSGPHRGMSGMLRMAEPRFWVLRPKVGKPVVSLTSRDPFTGPALVADNIHPAFRPREGVEFGSAGCQTVKGTFWKGVHHEPWATFRRAAGVTRDGLPFDYVLLTGAEARLASAGPAPELARLRFGSRGPEVRRVQELLGTGVDGVFGPATMKAVIDWQRVHQGGRADGIASQEVLKRLQ